MQLVLRGDGGRAATDHHLAIGDGAADLLHRLQPTSASTAGLQACPHPAAPKRPWRRGDRSVQVHACHGRARQVEVIRDTVLHLLGEDPTLEPRT